MLTSPHFFSALHGQANSSEHREDPRQSAGRPTCSLARCAALGEAGTAHTAAADSQAGDVTHRPKSRGAYHPIVPVGVAQLIFPSTDFGVGIRNDLAKTGHQLYLPGAYSSVEIHF